MRTTQGAISVMLVELFLHLLPPHNDATFVDLPRLYQFYTIAVLCTIATSGIILFLHSLFSECQRSKE